jgi:hypothetical protein
MLDKKNFCILAEGMIKDYDNALKIYDVLSPFGLYINFENQPLNTMAEKLINENFSEVQSELIFDYIYPVMEDREDISVEDFYDRLIGE